MCKRLSHSIVPAATSLMESNMPRAKKPEVVNTAEELQTNADPASDYWLTGTTPQQKGVTLRYSPADMDKLDQFAIGLLGPNSGAGYSNDEIFESRVRAAYLRAEVVLTIRKEIAALEA